MEAFKIFLLGVSTCLATAVALASMVIAILGACAIKAVCIAAFILFIVAIALLVAIAEERQVGARYLAGLRRRRSPAKPAQVMQIKVEADTSQACAAIDDLQRRIEHTNAMMAALERIAIHNVMGEPT